MPISRWYLFSDGKQSGNAGLLCKRCSTEFDIIEEAYVLEDENNAYSLASDPAKKAEATQFDAAKNPLELVRSAASSMSMCAKTVMLLSDWQRQAAGVPTAAEQRALQQEFNKLAISKQHEEEAFRKREQQRRVQLHIQLAELVKKSVLGGFIPIETGAEHLPLDKSEALCWSLPAKRLKQRSRQGQSYWDLDDDGTLFVTTQRVVFATPNANRWQRPRSKMHTARIEYLGSGRDVLALVIGFDGLQKPVAFYFAGLTVDTTVDNCKCSVALTVTDLADTLQSQFGKR